MTRLSVAFRALRRAGIVARQRFMCCMGCGLSTLANEHEAGQHRSAAGCCFYHIQDAARLDEHGQCHLTFSAFERPRESDRAHDARTVALGHKIVTILEAHGVPCSWPGKADTRILIWRDAETARRAALVALAS